MKKHAFLLLLLLAGACASTPEHRPDAEYPSEILLVLATIQVDESRPPSLHDSYDRDAWKHWSDEDGDCQNTREEVLIREGNDIRLHRRGCRVKSGTWRDPYTGQTFFKRGDIDIDHVVPLKDAHMSGGHGWSPEKKQEYANSLRRPYHLLAVEDNANQRKRAKSPDKWMPPNAALHCDYLTWWTRIKAEWGLSMTGREHAFIHRGLVACTRDE